MRPPGPLLALLLLLLAAPLASQSVRGTLVAAPGGEPVPAALVVLLDAEGRTVASDQSDAGGRFDLRAAGPGEFRVRAERVGYATAAPSRVTLAAGETLELRLETAAAASVLEGLVVEAPERRCVVDPREGGRTAALWEEARKSLELAEHSRKRGAFRFTLRSYQRVLEPGSLTVRSQSAETSTARAATPYASLPAEDLAANGYVRTENGENVFYSPDAPVLLSDSFLDGHCFRVRPGRGSEAGLVGLAFEPTSGRRLPDVRGVLWLDAASAELRALSFEYTGLRGELAVPGEWGGRVEFERLPGGAVIVGRWELRMPVVARAAPRGNLHAAPRLSLAAVREQGAEVTSVALASGQVVRAATATAAAVRGVVFDSTRGVPLAGATVRLAGTPYTATTDAAGRFALAGVPEGRYTAAFAHPRLDSLAWVPEPAQVAVGATGEAAASLAIPRGAMPRAVAAEPVQGVVAKAAPAARDTAAVRLEGITVTAAASARLRGHGFYDRQRAGRGTFLDARVIAERDRARVVDLVNGIHGISGMPWNAGVLAGPAQRSYTVRRLGQRCALDVYLDGLEVRGNALDRLQPEQVAGIEVYVGSETPARFVSCHDCGPVCGAIVVWTKGGET